jgi:predicted ATP-grasp superfamily ATP-dependent carboligase
MRISIFEWLSGGGLWLDEPRAQSGHVADRHGDSLAAAGRQMAEALVADAAALNPSVIVRPFRDARLTETSSVRNVDPVCVDGNTDLPAELRRAAMNSDWFIFVAPETGGRLARCARWLADCQSRWLGVPSPELIDLAGNKNRMCRWLAARGVPVPSEPLDSGRQRAMHWVVKPADGAGGEYVRIVSREEARQWSGDDRWRVERLVAGFPASVSVLAGAAGHVLLPPTEQVLCPAPAGANIGSRYPLPDRLAQRAAELAARTLAALPAVRGYLGIDLVLGDADSGRDDVVVEVNPRWTTSYLLVRRMTNANLLGALIDLEGGGTPALCFSREACEIRLAPAIDPAAPASRAYSAAFSSANAFNARKSSFPVPSSGN